MSEKNQLYYGDNLDILRRMKDETVDLCYIDPPFNSKRNYNQIYNNIGADRAQAQAFIDTWTWDDRANQGLLEIKTNSNGHFTEQSIDLITGLEKVLKKGSLLAYLISMTLRINEIHRVLKPTGSFYLHCDPTCSHYLKLVLDGVFCPRGGDYKNEIVWKRTTAHSDAKKRFGKNRDIILFYTKNTDSYTWNPQYLELSGQRLKDYNYQDADGRLWASGDLSAKGLTGGGYEYEYKGIKSYWRCPIETMQQLDKENRLHFTAKRGIRIKRYLDENKGYLLQEIFDDINSISSLSDERLGYPTQKPEALLQRIIKASSNEGDVVLDAYCGCGTTVAVAQRLKRNWIGIDITYQSIALILRRLEDAFGAQILATISLSGVPRDLESAIALANKIDDRTRKEFEKWIVLTYSNNRAVIHEKKGGDKGIDGIAYIIHNPNQDMKKVILSVKSNKSLTPAVIRELNGTVEREIAACGVLLTLYTMPNLVKESKQYGEYYNEFTQSSYPKIVVVSVEEILYQNVRLKLPNVKQVLNHAEPRATQQEIEIQAGEKQ